MVEVPDRLLAKRAIEEAKEYGEFDVPGSIGVGKHGQVDIELDWTLNDLNPNECEVDMNDDSVVVTGEIQAQYSIQVSRRSRHHPAEYRTEYQPIIISIEMDIGELGQPTVYGEIA